MPIWLHLIAGIVLYFVTFFAIGITLMFLFFIKNGGGEPNLKSLWIVAGGITVGMMCVRFLYRRLVHARCPECGEKTYCKGARPIYYECSSCGHVHKTNVSEGRRKF